MAGGGCRAVREAGGVVAPGRTPSGRDRGGGGRLGALEEVSGWRMGKEGLGQPTGLLRCGRGRGLTRVRFEEGFGKRWEVSANQKPASFVG